MGLRSVVRLDAPRLSGGQRDDARDRPGEGCHLPGNGDHDLVGVLAAGDQLSIPSAQAHLRLPTDRLNLGRQLLQTELEMPAVLRRIPIRPRAFDQGAARTYSWKTIC